MTISSLPATDSIREAPRFGTRWRVKWTRGWRTTFGLATLIAFGMSTQYLAQLFVWRNWPLNEVLLGWLYVLRDRLIVAWWIALAILIFRVGQAGSTGRRTALLAVSVFVGAACGEWLVQWLYGGYGSFASLITHVLRWNTVALAVAASYYLWRTSGESRDSLRREGLRRASIEQQLTNTRLTALRKQIEPHFLFNTLATVRRLHRTEPQAGADMLANFIDYLCRLLPMLERSEVLLGEETDLVQAYLSVIQVRMSQRLHVQIRVPDALREAKVPPLALATLVENAIKHGLAPLPAGGRIEVFAERAIDGSLQLTVQDNGVGLKSDARGGTGLGLYNIRTRLATLHGARASLSVEANEPRGVRARMILPLRLGAT